jgi:hypothetical protein
MAEATEGLLGRVGSMNLGDVGDEVERLRKENEALKHKVTALEVAKDGSVGEEEGGGKPPRRLLLHPNTRFPLYFGPPSSNLFVPLINTIVVASLITSPCRRTHGGWLASRGDPYCAASGWSAPRWRYPTTSSTSATRSVAGWGCCVQLECS